MTTGQLLGTETQMDLVKFDGGQHLTLVRHEDGRIDLVDSGCSDTGTNLSRWGMRKLRAEIRNWLNCIECDEDEVNKAMENLPF